MAANKEFVVKNGIKVLSGAVTLSGDPTDNLQATSKQYVDGKATVQSVSGKQGDITLTSDDVGLGNVENKSSATIRGEITSSNITTSLGFTPEDAANKNALNGYAGLVNGKIDPTQLPAIAITDTSVVASEAAMLALTAETGDVAVRTDINKTFILRGIDATVLEDWEELKTPTDVVQSVNGQTGTVTLTSTHITEGTNQYFTNARARSALGVSGDLSYNSTTGVISYTTPTLATVATTGSYNDLTDKPANSSAVVGEVKYAATSPGGNWLTTGNTYLSATYPALSTAIGSLPYPSQGQEPSQIIPFRQWQPDTTRYYTPNCVATGAGITVAVGSNGGIVTTTDGINWKFRASSVTTAPTYFRAIIYANSMFVAVGDSGVIVTSTDGITWGQRPCVGLTNGLNNIIYANGRFVAVGDGSPGAIVTSTDGITWTNRSSGTGNNLFSVAYGAGLFVVVGNNVAMTSTDGVEWTSRTLPSSIYSDVIFANNMFVAVSSNGLVTSSDGITWTSRLSTSLYSVIYANEQFVAVGNKNVIYTSPDGINWTSRSSGMVTDSNWAWWNVRYHDSTFYAVGTGGFISTSTDGITWSLSLDPQGGTFITTYVIDGKVIGFGDPTVILAGAPRQEVMFSGGALNYITSSSLSGNQIMVAYGANTYVAVGQGPLSANATILSSSNGVDWTHRYAGVAGVSSMLNTVIFANSMFVAVGGSGTIVTSPDGINWTPRTNSAGLHPLHGLVYVDSLSLWVAVGGSGTIVTSPDGINWTTQTSNASTNTLFSIVYGNGLLVAVGGGGTIVTSPDGINWTPRTINVGGSALHTLAYGNGRFVAVSATSSNIVVSSPDGINWTVGSFPTSGGSNKGLAFGNGVFIVTGSGQFRSTDGITWTLIRDGSGPYNSVTFGGGLFVAVGTNGLIHTTPDGQVWTARINPNTSTTYYAISYVNSKFITVGSQVGATSDDGITWKSFGNQRYGLASTNCVIKENGKYFILSSSGALVTSDDGINWTYRKTYTSASLNGVAYGNGIYVIVGNQGVILTSPDAIEWTPRDSTIITSNKPANEVIFANGLFVVLVDVQSPHGSVITSSDGINWTAQPNSVSAPSGTAFSPQGLTYFNSKFIAVGGVGVQTSTDGISWSEVAFYGGGTRLNAVASNNDIVVAVGVNGVTAYSTDGINWNVNTLIPSSTLVSIIYYAGVFIAAGLSGALYFSRDGMSWYSSNANKNCNLPSTAGGNCIAVRESDNVLLIPNGSSLTLTNRSTPYPIVEIPLYSYNTGTHFYVPTIPSSGVAKAYICAS